MNPRAMSVWIEAAASSAVLPFRSVQARASVSPAVKKTTRSRTDASRRTTSSSAEEPPFRNCAASSAGRSRSGLEREVDAVGPVHDRDQRLRRQRLQLRRQPAVPVAERTLGVDVLDQPLQELGFGAERRIARLGLLPHPLEAALDVILVGDEQLELERGQLAQVADDCEERVGAANPAELRGCSARNVDQPDRRRCLLRGAHDLGDLGQPLVRDRRDPDVRSAVALRPHAGERREQRRLPGPGRADDPDIKRHVGVLARDVLLQRGERAVLERLDGALGLPEDRRRPRRWRSGRRT